MQRADLRDLLTQLLDEDGVRRSDDVLNAALNDGYQTVALTTQACEITKSFIYDAAKPCAFLWDNFFVPLAVYFNGSRLSPVRMVDIDQITFSWLDADPWTPLYYFTMGGLTTCPSLWVQPRPVTSGTVKMSYAAIPDRMVSDLDIPRLPAEHQYSIVLWAYTWELLKERTGLLANKAFRVFSQFIEKTNELRNYVYRRTPDRDWQTIPWDLRAVEQKMMAFEPQPVQPAGFSESKDLAV